MVEHDKLIVKPVQILYGFHVHGEKITLRSLRVKALNSRVDVSRHNVNILD